MSISACPKCGKTLRPGAQFCGNCGFTIPKDQPENAAASGNSASSPGTQTQVCPHCGKTLRVGAKFCNYCGQAISAESDRQSPHNETSSAEGTDPERFKSAQHMVSSKKAAGKRKDRRFLWTIAFVGVLLVCIFLGFAGFLYFRDPLGWQSTATQTQSQTEILGPSTMESTSIGTISPIVSTAISSATEPFEISSTPEPIESQTVTPTHLAADTVTPTVGLSPTSPAEIVILEDQFDDTLSTNWKSWGDPRPALKKGFGDSWLDLKAADRPGDAGVTSKVEISNSPGIKIELEAQLNPSYPQYWMYFDWDPLQFVRGPENSEPTIVHLVVQKNQVLLQSPAANNSCSVVLDGATKHVYTLIFRTEKIVELIVDGNPQPGCAIDMGVIPVPGRITFSGNGWVTRIKVSGETTP